MTTVRSIKKIWKSTPTIEGAGVHLKRAFGFSEVPQLDPFLLLDDFHSIKPEEYLSGFPWHPHRGIETITYVLNGKVEHGDSMGNKGTISSGDVQWMTAGSGIIHQEMPEGDRYGLLQGFQLWANLPASQKMMAPRYRDVKKNLIPVVSLDSGATVRIICGKVDGISGPVKDIVIEPEYLDITLPPHKSFSHQVKPGHTAFAYTIEGKAYFDQERNFLGHKVTGVHSPDFEGDCMIRPETLCLYDLEAGNIEVTTVDSPARFLLISGKPINEPVAWYGPIVMNTQEELELAFREYQNGTFIRDK